MINGLLKTMLFMHDPHRVDPRLKSRPMESEVPGMEINSLL